jgi:hypothetical protein
MSERHGHLVRQVTLPRSTSLQRQSSQEHGTKSATDLERNRKFMVSPCA